MNKIKVLVTLEYEVDTAELIEFAEEGEPTIVNREVIFPKVERVK